MKRAIKSAVEACDLDPKSWDTKQIQSFISRNKGNGKRLEDMTAGVDDGYSESYQRDTLINIWKQYEQIKKADQAYDFDDLLLVTSHLLKTNEQVREHYRRRWSHIHIDEYQDTNGVQNQLINSLVSPDSKNVFAVGDPDQLIYGWRGAKLKNIMRFEKDFAGGETVILEQNYRSSKHIIEASNAVIKENKERFEKKLFTEKAMGEPISLYNAYDAPEEAQWIAGKIKDAIANGTKPSEIAVLYRANFQSRLLEEKCLQMDIPYQVLGTKFYDRAEVKDVLSYIQSALNPDSLVHVKRVINMPKRSLGKTSVLKIFAGKEAELTARAAGSLATFRAILKDIKDFIDEGYPTSEIITFVIERSGLEALYRESKKDEDAERLANMYELATVAQKYDRFDPADALVRFLEEVALASDQDSKDDTTESVKLLTIHSAKGLEFEHVFVTGCEAALFSPRVEMDKKQMDEKLEEERRLFYVAMTRAKEKLYLSWANIRIVYGQTETNLICAFVLDIPEELLVEENKSFNFAHTQFKGDDDGETIVYLDF